MAAFSGPGQDYLDSDVHLVHNDHHAAPDLTTKSRPAVQPETMPVDGELINVPIEIAPGTLSVHDLAVAALFSGTVLVCVGPSHRSWMMLRGSGVDDI